MEHPQDGLFTEEDYKVFTKYRKEVERHAGYCRRVRQYARMNRMFLEEAGWLDWAFEEASRPFVPEKPLPKWSDEAVAAMRSRYDRRQSGQK